MHTRAEEGMMGSPWFDFLLSWFYFGFWFFFACGLGFFWVFLVVVYFSFESTGKVFNLFRA